MDEKTHILLIEDNPVDQELLRIYLHDSALNIVKLDAVERLREGLEKLEENSYDLVLLDLSLPDSDDMDGLVAIRIQKPWMPVIILTGNSDPEIPIKAINQGAQDYLIKGTYTPEQLERCIRYARERKRSEQQLQQSRSKFRSVFETAPVGIPISDLGGAFVDANNTFCRMVGYSLEELLKKKISDLTLPEDLEESNQLINQLTQGDLDSFQVEKRYIRKDGSVLWCLTAVTLLKNLDGHPENMVAMLVDISERKNAERLLSESETKYRSLVNNIAEGIIRRDMDEKIIYVNDSFCKMIGYEEKELLGQPISFVIAADEASKKLMAEHMEKRKLGLKTTFIMRVRRKSEEILWVSVSGSPVYDSKGKMIGAQNLVLDITDLKNAEREVMELNESLEERVEQRTMELRQAQEKLAASLEKEKDLSNLKSHFVSTASHQFRTPLTIIQSSIAILSMMEGQLDEKLKAQFRKVADRIRGQIRRMTELMDDILILGKLDATGIQGKLTETDLVALVRDLLQKYEEIPENKGRVHLKIKGTPNEVELDENLMEHAISNLVSNALKYSITGSGVNVEISFEEDTPQVKIMDQGIGIPKDQLDKIFEPFFRAGNTENVPGTGLGMTIVKEYLGLNNASIDIESKVGEGTTVTLTFNS
ncbi:MAG: PAS domain S-box protein [Flavobacteriales bacterium]